MKAVVTVTGTDRKGIIAQVSAFLSAKDINILDISQTIMGDQFAMVMLVDATDCKEDFASLSAEAAEVGKKIGMTVRLQHEDIFNAMHTV